MCAAPARRGGRCPFNRRRVVPRRSRESPGGRGGGAEAGGPWRMEAEMEPETLEARISECPGGARAGPEPEPGARGGSLPGGGGVRGAPSSRPAPGPGGAVPRAGTCDPEMKEDPPTGWTVHPIPGQQPSGKSELRPTLRPAARDGGSSLRPPRPRLPHRVLSGGPGREQASAGLHLRPGGKDLLPVGPSPPLPGPARPDSPCPFP